MPGLAAEGSAACYEKAKAAAIAILPLSSAIALDMLPSAGRDGVPMLAAGMGAAMVADGRYFPWAFALPATDIDGAQAILQAISGQADALQGKTIALLRLDVPETEDIAALLQMQSGRLGFTLLDLPVAAKAVRTQSAAMARNRPQQAGLRRDRRPRGHGRDRACRSAQCEFSDGRLIGTSWSATGAELALIGDAAKGYRVVSWNLPGADPQILRDIAEARAGADRSGHAAAERAGLYYQRGVVPGRSWSRRSGWRNRISTGATSTACSCAGCWST